VYWELSQCYLVSSKQAIICQHLSVGGSYDITRVWLVLWQFCMLQEPSVYFRPSDYARPGIRTRALQTRRLIEVLRQLICKRQCGINMIKMLTAKTNCLTTYKHTLICTMLTTEFFFFSHNCIWYVCSRLQSVYVTGQRWHAPWSSGIMLLYHSASEYHVTTRH